MSQFFYNGIELELVKFNLIARDAVFAADNTTYLFTKWTIDVNTIYNPAATAYNYDGTIPDFGPPTPTDGWVRSQLMQPRGLLKIYNGNPADGNTLIYSPFVDSNGNQLLTDCNNGPIPKSLTIKKIEGTITFFVNFVIETYINECPVPGPYDKYPNPILSNRYDQTEVVDEQFRTTRRYTGAAIMRTDFLNVPGQAPWTPDHFRNNLLPPLITNFKRVSIDIKMSSAQSALIYEVIDVEQFTSIGDQHQTSGVTSWQGKYFTGTVSAGKDSVGVASLTSKAQVHMQILGEMSSTTQSLINFGFKAIYSKLGLDNKLIINGAAVVPLLTDVQIATELNQRSVEIQCSVLLIPPAANGNAIGIMDLVRLNNNQLTIFTNDGTNPQPYSSGLNSSGPSRGSLQTELFLQQLKAACQSTPQKFNPPALDPSGPNVNYVGPYVNVQLVPNFPYYQTYNMKSTTYTDYQVSVLYETDQNVMVAPVASLNVGCSVIQTASPITTKIVEWEAQNYGSQPAIPNSTPTDSNLTLLSANIQPYTPNVLPDASTIGYRVSGRYVYALTKPISDGDKLQTAALPWTSLQFSDGQYNNYSNSIVDLTSSGYSGGGGNS